MKAKTTAAQFKEILRGYKKNDIDVTGIKVRKSKVKGLYAIEFVTDSGSSATHSCFKSKEDAESIKKELDKELKKLRKASSRKTQLSFL